MFGKIIAGIMGIAILVAVLPYIMSAMAELEGTIVGYCQGPNGVYRVTLGDDIRSAGITGSSVGTEATAECTKSTSYTFASSTTFVAPSGGPTVTVGAPYTYVPTATSNNSFVTLISTIVNLWPVLLIVLLLFAIFKLFGGDGLGVNLGGLLTNKRGGSL